MPILLSNIVAPSGVVLETATQNLNNKTLIAPVVLGGVTTNGTALNITATTVTVNTNQILDTANHNSTGDPHMQYVKKTDILENPELFYFYNI